MIFGYSREAVEFGSGFGIRVWQLGSCFFGTYGSWRLEFKFLRIVFVSGMVLESWYTSIVMF